LHMISVFFFQAEDGIRDRNVTGVQTCALPISFDRKWMSRTSKPTTIAITEANAEPITSHCKIKIIQESNTILTAAVTTNPAIASVGLPSFLTKTLNTDSQVINNEKTNKTRIYSFTYVIVSALAPNRVAISSKNRYVRTEIRMVRILA